MTLITEKPATSVSMLGWALNEEENIGPYIDRAAVYLATLTDDYELILIEDGSTDRTWQIIQQHRATRPWLRAYRNDRNRGPGFNTKRAISLATKEYLLWQTVDWAYDISIFVKAWPLLREFDVLQGVRPNVSSIRQFVFGRSDTPHKALISYVNYGLIRLLFRLPFSDYQNVTVYPTRLIQSIRLEADSSFINPECLLKSWWLGASFKEVPVPFLKRERGTAKGTRPSAIVRAIADILRCWCLWIVLGRRDKGVTGQVSYADEP